MNIPDPFSESIDAAMMKITKALLPLDKDILLLAYVTLWIHCNLSPAKAPSLDKTLNATNTDSELSDGLADFIVQADIKTDADIILIIVHQITFRSINPNVLKIMLTSKVLKATGCKIVHRVAMQQELRVSRNRITQVNHTSRNRRSIAHRKVGLEFPYRVVAWIVAVLVRVITTFNF